MSRSGAADVGPLAIVSDQLLASIGDMSAKGGEEIESGTGRCGRRIRSGAAIMSLGIIGDLAGFSVIVQSIQGNGRVNTVSGEAFSGLMVVRREATSLEYRKPRMVFKESEYRLVRGCDGA